MISAEERISLLKAITNAFEDDEMPYDGNSINHFEKHMIKFLDELRKPGKDANDVAREYASRDYDEFNGSFKSPAWEVRYCAVIFGWQAKESREAARYVDGHKYVLGPLPPTPKNERLIKLLEDAEAIAIKHGYTRWLSDLASFYDEK